MGNPFGLTPAQMLERLTDVFTKLVFEPGALPSLGKIVSSTDGDITDGTITEGPGGGTDEGCPGMSLPMIIDAMENPHHTEAVC